MVGVGRPLLPEILGTPLERNRRFWTDIRSFCDNARVWQRDRRTDGQTEFSSLDGVCIPCSAVKTSACYRRYGPLHCTPAGHQPVARCRHDRSAAFSQYFALPLRSMPVESRLRFSSATERHIHYSSSVTDRQRPTSMHISRISHCRTQPAGARRSRPFRKIPCRVYLLR